MSELQHKEQERKYNPDVLNNYKDMKRVRDKDEKNYELKNTPYKTIINNEDYFKPIRSHKDFMIEVNADNTDIKNRLAEIMDDRKYEDKVNKEIYRDDKREEYEKKFQFRNLEIYALAQEANEGDDDEMIDHEGLKSTIKDYYKRQEREVQKEKERFNSLLQSLKDAGIA